MSYLIGIKHAPTHQRVVAYEANGRLIASGQALVTTKINFHVSVYGDMSKRGHEFKCVVSRALDDILRKDESVDNVIRSFAARSPGINPIIRIEAWFVDKDNGERAVFLKAAWCIKRGQKRPLSTKTDQDYDWGVYYYD